MLTSSGPKAGRYGLAEDISSDIGKPWVRIGHLTLQVRRAGIAGVRPPETLVVLKIMEPLSAKR